MIEDGPENGVTGAWHDIDPASLGLPFTIVFAAKPDSVGYEYAFYNSGGRIAVEAASGAPPTGTGTVPDDAIGIAFRNCGAQGTSATYTAG
jgi:hypothetical protein